MRTDSIYWPSVRRQRNFRVPSSDTSIQRQPAEGGPLGQLLAEGPADVGHLVKVLSPLVKPLGELPGPVPGLAPGLDALLQFLQGEFF